MSPAPITTARSSSDATRIRHGLTAVLAQYIQDLAHSAA
jgi:hypothetical protein